MSALPRTFGGYVLKCRRAAGVTLTVAAEAAGVSKSYWSDIEHGRRLPALDAADRMAEAVAADTDMWTKALLRERLGDEVYQRLRLSLIREFTEWVNRE